MTSCAILSPRLKLTARSVSVLSRVTLISPRYPASTVPGAFDHRHPVVERQARAGMDEGGVPGGQGDSESGRTRARSPGASTMSSCRDKVRARVSRVGILGQRETRVQAFDQHIGSGSQRKLLHPRTHGEDSATSRPRHPFCGSGWRGPPWSSGSGSAGSRRLSSGRARVITATIGTATRAPGYACHHAADGEREDDRKRVKPDRPADDLGLKQVGFELILDDQHAEQDDGVHPALGASVTKIARPRPPAGPSAARTRPGTPAPPAAGPAGRA